MLHKVHKPFESIPFLTCRNLVPVLTVVPVYLGQFSILNNYQFGTIEQHGSGERHKERHRRGDNTSRAAVCASQISVNFCQSSGTVLL